MLLKVILLLLLGQQFDIINQVLCFIWTFAACYALINCVHEENRIFDSSLDYWPKLFNKHTQTGALLLGFLNLLIEQFLTIFQ